MFGPRSGTIVTRIYYNILVNRKQPLNCELCAFRSNSKDLTQRAQRKTGGTETPGYGGGKYYRRDAESAEKVGAKTAAVELARRARHAVPLRC